MIKGCKLFGMKPVCDHRAYCVDDVNSVFIGQTHHIAYRPHRRNNNYMPGGFDVIQDKWDGLLKFTAVSCKKAKTCTATQVANSDKASKGSIKGMTSALVKVKCSSGYFGGGYMLCGSNGKFSWDTGGPCKKVSYCKATQVPNSNFAKKGSMTGHMGANGVGRTELNVKCASGYKGGGLSICGVPKAGEFTPITCSKPAPPPPPPPPPPPSSDCSKRSRCHKADVDGNKKINIEDLLALLSVYGNKC
eukprot:COSAG05_NODE_113_length_18220_cov_398.853162_5_plen_247_part_00